MGFNDAQSPRHYADAIASATGLEDLSAIISDLLTDYILLYSLASDAHNAECHAHADYEQRITDARFYGLPK
jgi:hypothetical protein